jgi:CheY-like chemotaxis protein
MLRTKLGDNPLAANVDRMLEAAQRASQLTKDLLAFSRKQSIAARPLDLNDLVPKISKLIARLIGEDIELETVLAGGELPVLADSGRIEQVLMNLATNARDAMPGGGTLRIHTTRTLIDEVHAKAYGYGIPGEYALIAVSDSGAGMDARTRDQIFEPFFTTKEVGKGTGLGLATAYGIVKQHGGHITVYSEVGKGTVFRIYLPLIGAAVERVPPAAAAPPPPRGSETILVAEDDPSLRAFAKNLLEEYGYRVIEARDGEEAVRRFREHPDEIGILLLDIVMPKMNGRIAYEEIAKLRPGIKVLFASGYTADIISVKDIIDEGLNFIQKPMAPRELLGKLRQVLDG